MIAFLNIQGVPKGTDTFPSLMIQKLDNLQKFLFISLKSLSNAIFLSNFGKTVNLSFNGLTSVNSL